MRSFWLAVSLLFTFLTSCSSPVPNSNETALENQSIYDKNAELARGINFGNYLEANNFEGAWTGGQVIQPYFFDKVKEAGFQTIRLPVGWSYHAGKSAPYTIDETFFKRVDWMVDQATQRGLNIIVNFHYYDELHTNPQSEEARFLAIWRQISNRYKTRSDNVYFELLNEPHGEFNDNPELWNTLLAKALTVVRQTNPTRAVIIGPVSWNSIGFLSRLRLPNDPNIIATVHFYSPIEFTHQGSNEYPKGISWSATNTVPAWDNWSWNTRLRPAYTGALEVSFLGDSSGVYLHTDIAAQGYTSLAVVTNKAMSFQISCGSGSSKPLQTRTNQEAVVDLTGCSSITDLQLANQTGAAQTFILSKLELRGSGQTPRSLLIPAGTAIRRALTVAKRWSNSTGRPIFLGEFGTNIYADTDSRANWTSYVRSEAEKRGVSWSYWAFGADFDAFDLTRKDWNYPILKALIP